MRQEPGRGLHRQLARRPRQRACRRARQRTGARARVAGRRLPVTDHQLGREPALPAGAVAVPARRAAAPAPGRHDQDAAGRQRPVVEMPAVRVVDRLDQLADHGQPGAGVETVAVPVEIVVQAHLVRPVTEDQRRARLVAFQPVDLDDPRMVDPVQHQELAAGGRLPLRPLGLPRGPLDEVDPHPSPLGGDLDVGGMVVLPGRAGVERRELQLPGAHPLVAPAAGDPGRRQQPGQGLRQLGGDPLPFVAQRRVQQAGPDRRQRHAAPAAPAAAAAAAVAGALIGGAAGGASLGAEDPVELVVGELDPQGRVRQEDHRLDERDPRPRPARAAGVLQ